MQTGILVQRSSQGRELPTLNDGPVGKASELRPLSLSPCLLIWDALPDVSCNLKSPNPVTEQSPYCSAVCLTCVVCFLINSIMSGQVTAVQCLNTVFSTFTAMVIFFLNSFSIFGKEVILIRITEGLFLSISHTLIF